MQWCRLGGFLSREGDCVVSVRTDEWLRGWLSGRECSGADSVDFKVARVTLCCVGADRRMATWVAKWTR
ncbi:hypothetical protein TIFTF001_053253, partial [Ficus carica]